MLGPMVFVTIGDEYDKKDPVPDRFKGKNMLTSAAPKRGFTLDSCFTKKVLSLSENDRYVDPGYYEKRRRIESEKKKVAPNGFRYSSPSHKSCGAGDYFGTFMEKSKPEHVPVDRLDADASPKKVAAEKRNILVAPAKRGTYGFPGLSIGPKDKQIKYISDPYDGQKRADALAAKAAKPAGPAFKAACKHQDFFDVTPAGYPKVYTIDKPLPAKRSTSASSAASGAKKGGPAWKPGGVMDKSMPYSKLPAYTEDPYELREKKSREERLAREKALKAGHVWKPIGGSKTLPVRPIKFTPA
jgi:hypothetical protein